MPSLIEEKDKKPLHEWIMEWTLKEFSEYDYNDIHNKIEYMSKKSYDEYHPTIGPFNKFRARLQLWIDNVTTIGDKKILFRLVPEITFLGSNEFISLYRTAFNELVLQWIFDCCGLKFTDPNLSTKLRTEIERTWFCPITDSMHISDFYHVNNIKGIDYRPDWRSLAKLGDIDKVLEYINSKNLQRIVLLEDFVGSGSQLSGKDGGEPSSVDFAATLPGSPPLLILPLVTCPAGYRLGKGYERKYGHLKFKTTYLIPGELLLTPQGHADETELFGEVRELVTRHDKVIKFPYGAFGYLSTGALFVMYTNCPDNTLPIIHFDSDKWKPLFPRSSRI